MKFGKYRYKKRLIFALIFSLTLPQCAIAAGNTGIVYAASQGTCTATTLYIRKGPATSYDQVTVNGAGAYLVKGQQVTILGEKNGWYEIKATFNGKEVTGYSSGAYITVSGSSVVTPTPTPTPNATPTPAPSTPVSYVLSLPAKVNATTLNVRKVASATATKLGTITKGAAVTVIGETYNGSDKWYKVTVTMNGTKTTGYVLSDYITLTLSTGFYAGVNADSTLLRESAGANKAAIKTSAGVAVSLNKGTAVWVSGETTVSGVKYFKVGLTYKGETVRGYVKATEIELLGKKVTTSATPTPTVKPTVTPTAKPTATPTPTPPASAGGTSNKTAVLKLPASVTASDVNIRSTAGTSGTKLGTLAKGTGVTVIGAKIVSGQKWYQVNVTINGKSVTGYVLSDYV
ncbi:MAG: SH3 domain-containing protein, partial [Lachnospiraceae bacterium]|nr:SH3 domain-containing protein [Lachnospiraceae bacterium]